MAVPPGKCPGVFQKKPAAFGYVNRFMHTPRLIVAVDYQRQVMFIRFIGTHAQYDTIDAEVV
jgi:hypothetical protein